MSTIGAFVRPKPIFPQGHFSKWLGSYLVSWLAVRQKDLEPSFLFFPVLMACTRRTTHPKRAHLLEAIQATQLMQTFNPSAEPSSADSRQNRLFPDSRGFAPSRMVLLMYSDGQSPASAAQVEGGGRYRAVRPGGTGGGGCPDVAAASVGCGGGACPCRRLCFSPPFSGLLWGFERTLLHLERRGIFSSIFPLFWDPKGTIHFDPFVGLVAHLETHPEELYPWFPALLGTRD